MDDNKLLTITISIPKPSRRLLRISLSTLLLLTVGGGMFLGLAGRKMQSNTRPVERELEAVLRRMNSIDEAFVELQERHPLDPGSQQRALISVRATGNRFLPTAAVNGIRTATSRSTGTLERNVTILDLNSGVSYSL